MGCQDLRRRDILPRLEIRTLASCRARLDGQGSPVVSRCCALHGSMPIISLSSLSDASSYRCDMQSIMRASRNSDLDSKRGRIGQYA